MLSRKEQRLALFAGLGMVQISAEAIEELIHPFDKLRTGTNKARCFRPLPWMMSRAVFSAASISLKSFTRSFSNSEIRNPNLLRCF